MTRKWSFTLCFLLSISAQASVQSFSFKTDKLINQFSIDIPKDWQETHESEGNPGQYGVQLILFAPENKDNARPVILVMPTGIKDKQKLFKQENKDNSVYKEGREEWLKERDGKSISYDPVKEEKWPGIEGAYHLGFHYELADGKYYERSTYIVCDDRKIYALKALVQDKYEREFNPIINKTIQSFRCVDGGKN